MVQNKLAQHIEWNGLCGFCSETTGNSIGLFTVFFVVLAWF